MSVDSMRGEALLRVTKEIPATPSKLPENQDHAIKVPEPQTDILFSTISTPAGMAELADAADSKSAGA